MAQNLVSPEYYATLVQQHGKAGADAILRKEGWRVDVPEPDFTPVGAPMASASPTGGLGGGTGMDGDDDNEGRGEDALPIGALSYADAQREAAAANQGLYGQIQSNISVLDAAREALRNRRFAPSNSEKWLAIAAALGQPTRTGSFGESLGNLAQALGAQKAERRKFEQEAEMLGLKYGLEAGTERMRLAQARATEADRTLRAVVAANKPKPGTWSENMGQFVSPDNPVATQNKVRVGKYLLTKYTDGSLRLKNPDGTYSVYTEDGVKIRDIPAGGAK